MSLILDGKEFLSAREAAEVSSYTADYISRLIRSGEMAGQRIGRAWFVERATLDAFLKKSESEHAERSEALRQQRLAELHKPVTPTAPTAPAASNPAFKTPPLLHASVSAVSAARVLAGGAMVATFLFAFAAGTVASSPEFGRAAALTLDDLIHAPARTIVAVAEFDIRLGSRLAQIWNDRDAVAVELSNEIVSAVHSGTDSVRRTNLASVGAYGSSAFNQVSGNTANVIDSGIAWYRSLFNSIALWFKKDETVVLVATSTPRTSKPVAAAPAPQSPPRPVAVNQTVVNRSVTERVTENIIYTGVSESLLAAKLNELESRIRRDFSPFLNQNPNPYAFPSGAGGINAPITHTIVSSGSSSVDLGSISGILAVSKGGTGTSTAPSYGQLLLGNASGGYDLVATSSLGISAGLSGSGADNTLAYWSGGNLLSTTSPTVGFITATSTTASSTFSAGISAAAAQFANLISCDTIDTDASGYLKCGSDSGAGVGSPGGADTAVQYNTNGAFGGDAGFTYASSTDTLTVVNASTTRVSASYASSTNAFFGSLSIGSLSGFLKATAGAVSTSLVNLASDITGTLGIANGGTGTTTAPVGQLLYGGSSAYQSVATTSLSLSGAFSHSGTLGALVGGSSGTLSLATNGVSLTNLAQIAANTILGNSTGATGNVTAIATSSLGVAISDTTGTLSIARGGTGTTTSAPGYLTYWGSSTQLGIATTSVSCSGTASCTSFTAIGTSPVTITGSGLSAYDAFTHPLSGWSATTSILKAAGLYSTASSTIGDGTQAGGLTVNGGATTTGNAYIGGGTLTLTDNGGPATGTIRLGAGNFTYNGSDYMFTGGNVYTAANSIVAQANSSALGLGARYQASAGTYWFGATNSATPDLVLSNNAGTERARLTDGGNFGIGTTSPYAKLSVVGEIVASHFTATTSATSTFAGPLSVSRLAITGNSGLLKSSAGGYVVNATAGTDYIAGGAGAATTTVSCSGNASCTSFVAFGSSPITISASGGSGTSAYEIATTSSIAVPDLAYFTQTGGRTTLGSVATTSLSLSGAFSHSGTLGALVGGSSGTLSLATNGVSLTNLAQIAANTILGNSTGATGNVTAVATSSLFTWSGTGSVVRDTSPTLTTPNLGTPSAITLTNGTGLPLTTGVTGTLGIANGGTGTTTAPVGHLIYGGTSAYQSVATSSISLGASLSTTAGSLGYQVGGSNVTINTVQDIRTSASPTFVGLTLSGLADGCLQANSGALTSTGSACGTGGGGGGGGTWSTTTSSVAGQLINYSGNFDDIVAIGSNATTSAEYWFDPNTTTAYLAGSVGIGTTSPWRALSVLGASDLGTNALAGSFTGTTSATSTLVGGVDTARIKTSATSTFAGVQIASEGLSIGSLSGFLKATAGAVTTATIDLVNDVGSSILAVANGGTGWANLQANTVLLGNGTSRIATTSAGTNGQVLALVGGVPTWTSTTTFSGGLTYSGGNVTADLGTSIVSSEITDDTIVNADINSAAAIAYSKLNLVGSIANSDLVNSSVSFGGVSVSLGGSDATPAFDLTDATNLPIVAGTTGTLSIARGGTGTTTVPVGHLIYGGSSAYQSVATTSLSLGLGLSHSGTLGAFVGGTSGTLSIATSSLYTGATGQVAYFDGTNSIAGTSSLSIATNGDVTVPRSLTITGTGISGATPYLNVASGGFTINGNGVAIGGDSTPDAMLEVIGGSLLVSSGSGASQNGDRLALSTVTGFLGLGTTTPYGRISVDNITSGTGILANALTGFTGKLLDLQVASSSVFSVNQAGALSLGSALTIGNGGTGTTTAPVSQLLYGGSSAYQSVATTSLSLSGAFSHSGTLGALVGGSAGTLSLATNGVSLTNLAQIAANTILGNSAGATGNVTAIATSSLGIAISDTTGTLSIARGGTGTTTSAPGYLTYWGSSTQLGIATTSVSCSGTASCTSFTAIGSSPVTITGSGLSAYDAFTHPLSGWSATTSILKAAGLYSTASSTIGDGTQAGGLTVNGGATTTGNAYIGGGTLTLTDNGGPATGTIRLGAGNFTYNGSDYMFTGGNVYTAANSIVAQANSSALGLGARYQASAGTYWFGATNSATPDLVLSNNAGTERVRLTDGGNFGIGTTSPYAKLSVVGEVVASYFTATTSATSTFAGPLSVSRLAITGNSGLLKSSAGGYVVNATAGTDYIAGGAGAATTTVSCSGNASCTSFVAFGSSPITISASGGSGTSAYEIATTSSIAVPDLAYFTQTGGRTTLGSVATTSLSLSGAFSHSGTLGALVGGSSGTLSLATNGVSLTNLAQIAANTILGNSTGATGNVTAVATSSLFTWSGTGSVVRDTSPTLTTPNLGTPSAITLTNGTGLPLTTGVTGTLGIANGGTGTTTAPVGHLIYGGTSAYQSVATSSFSLGASLSTTAGSLGYQVGGTNVTINTVQDIRTSASPTFVGLTLSGLADGCLQANSGALTSTGSACGTGGGGGSGGTWSTTTSQVAGRLINYSNNFSDIVAIGSNATTSAEYWFDPNTTTAYLSGFVGIGTTSPYARLSVVGQAVAEYFSATSTTLASVFPLANITKLSNLTTDGVVYTSGSDGTLNVDAGALDVARGGTATTTFYGGGVVFSDGSKLTQSRSAKNFFWSETDERLGIGTSSPQTLLHVSGATQGAATIESQTGSFGPFLSLKHSISDSGRDWQLYSAGSSQVGFGGAGSFNIYDATAAATRLTITIAGNVGVGSTTPLYKLSVEGSSSLGNEARAGYFTGTTTATSTLAGGIDTARVKTSATSTFAGVQIASGGLSIGSLSGFLKATAGAVTTATIDLVNDVGSSVLSVANGGTGTTTFYGGGIVYSDGSKLTQSRSAKNFFWNETDERLGIGTSSPQTLLHVSGATQGAATIESQSGNFGPYLSLKHSVSDNGRDWQLYSAGSGQVGFGGAGSFNIYDATAAATRLTITTGGNIGVGSSTPSYKFVVEGTSSLGNEARAGYFTGTTTATSTLAGGIDTARVKTSATSTFAGVQIASEGLSIGSLSGFLKATAGAVTTATIDLVNDVGSSILAVANGGTGWSNLQANTVLLGNGTSRIATTSAGTNGQVLALVGGVPTWTSTTTFSGGLTYSGGNVTADLGTSIDSTEIVDNSIVNADINSSAAIAYSKLNLASSITNSDVSSSAAIAYSKLNLAGSVQNSDLVNSTISGISLGSNLANLSATDSTLTFSGTYNGGTARTIGLNLGNANTWTVLQQFGNASTSLLSSYGPSYFGGTATTTIDRSGNVVVGGTLQVTGQTTLATSLSGILKAASGVVSAAVAGTDYIAGGAGAATTTLTLAGPFNTSATPVVFGSSPITSTYYGLATTTSLSSSNLLYSTNGAAGVSSVATTSLSLSGAFSHSGTLGALVGGSAGTLSLATNGVSLTNLAQIAANSILGNSTGATGNVTAVATSSLFTWSGTGSVVRDTSPTLTTPNLGTPSAITLTNGTGLPLSTGVTGTLGIANGGTGTTTTAAGYLTYWGSSTQLGVATTTVSCSGTASCTSFTAIGASPITISGTGLTSYDAWSHSATYGSTLASATTSPLWAQSGLYASSTVAFGTAGKDLYFDSSTGKLGVGSTTPWAQLSVNPTSANGADPAFAIGSSTATTFIVTNAGKVGIGDLTPRGGIEVNKTGTSLFASTFLEVARFADSSGDKGISLGYDSSAQVGGIFGSTVSANSQIAFYTYNSGFGERARISAAGNLGIGTTTPSAKLEVTDSSAASTTALYLTNLGSATSSTKIGLAFRTNDFANNTGTTTADIFSVYQGGTGGVPTRANGDLAFSTLRSGSLTESLRLTSAGNLGIGTTTPWGQLSVNPSALGSGVPEFVVGSTTATHLVVTGAGNVGIGLTSPTELLTVSTSNNFVFAGFQHLQAANDTGGYLTFRGGTTGSTDRGFVGFTHVGSGSDTFFTGELANAMAIRSQGAFQLGTNGDNIRLTIDTSGNVGIGTTTPAQLLSVGGNVIIGASTAGGSNGTLTYGGVTLSNSVTGTGSMVLSTSPTLTTPNLGTPSAITLTNGTGLPISTGVSGLGTGVATALGVNVGSAGAFVTFNGALGTPSSGTLTNATGLPISTGVSGLGSGVATFLATPSSANLATAVTGETGSGALVFGTTPTVTTLTVSSGGIAVTGNSTIAGTLGSLTGITSTGLTSLANASTTFLSNIGTAYFGATATTSISSTGAITTPAVLTVSSGGITVTGNSTITGTLGSLTGVTSSGTITFSGLTASRNVCTTTGGQLTVTCASADMIASLTDETGTGSAVFSASPTLTGTLTAASATFSGTGAFGTTTAAYPLTAYSNTTSQLALSFGAGFSQWAFNNVNGNLYIATTTVAGTATSTTAALQINTNGTLIIGGGTGKITLGTFDPVYTINGTAYATYAAGMIGIKEEVTGVADINQQITAPDGTEGYARVISFDDEPEGSDLWLFAHTTHIRKNIGELAVLLSSEKGGKVWYQIDRANRKVYLLSDKPARVSYRMTAPRFDSEMWTNYNHDGVTGFTPPADDQSAYFDASGFSFSFSGDLLSGTTTVSELTSSPAEGAPAWAGALAGASDGLKNALAALSGAVIQAYEGAQYFADGIFKRIFAGEVHTDMLCVTDSGGQTCITRSQLDALIAGAAAAQNNQTPPPAAPDENGEGEEGAPDTEAPVITVQGNNPAEIFVGDTYADLGASVTDNLNSNLGVTTLVDGVEMQTPVIDTSLAGTHTITYRATDQAGNIGEATRTVIVSEVPSSGEEPPQP